MRQPQRTWDEIRVGEETELIEPMSSQRLVMWAAASGDYYQIHYDEGFARANALPGVIVHGALKGMLVGRLLDEWVGERGRIVSWGVSYRGMDPVGEDLRVWGRVTRKYEKEGEPRLDLDVGVDGASGRTSTPGHATVALPRAS